MTTCLWPTAGPVLDIISGFQFDLFPQDIGARIIIPKVIIGKMGQDGRDPTPDQPVTRPIARVSGGLRAFEVVISPIAE